MLRTGVPRAATTRARRSSKERPVGLGLGLLSSGSTTKVVSARSYRRFPELTLWTTISLQTRRGIPHVARPTASVTKTNEGHTQFLGHGTPAVRKSE